MTQVNTLSTCGALNENGHHRFIFRIPGFQLVELFGTDQEMCVPGSCDDVTRCELSATA